MFSRNGISKEFKITVVDKYTGVKTPYTFSFKHQALEEWTREKWLYDEFDDGSKEQEFKYLDYYFRIDWSELIVGEDADKLEDVRNAEFHGHGLILQPHLDALRYFNIISFKSEDGDSEEIHFSQIVNSRASAGNKGTVILYVTKNPHTNWSILDPSKQSSVSAMTFEEYI